MDHGDMVQPNPPSRASQNRLALFLGTSAQMVVTLFVIRVIIDTGTRMVYPYSPQLARA